PSTRRGFLHSTILVGSAAITAPALSAAREIATPASVFEPPPFELEEITIDALQQGMQSGKYTARSITEAYLARIKELDKEGPGLNSVIEVNPDAVEIAEMLDKERKEKRPRGRLHGIPLLVKDNLDTADKMLTTAGSLALVDCPRPQKDSVVV